MNNLRKILLFVSFFILLIINSVFIFRNPWFDWDIVSYIWNVKYIENKDKEEVHTETYEELKEYLDAWRYKIILQANKYRKEVYKETESFFDIMPFYNIKFIYVWTIYFFTKLWLWTINAILAVSIISYLIFNSLLYFIFRKEVEENNLFFFPLYLLTFSSPILIAWRSTTPDMYWAMFAFLWTFLIIKKQLLAWIIILILSLWVRTDNIIFIWLLLFYLKFFTEKEYKINYLTFFISWIAALGFYKWINTFFHNFWYWKLYYNSFIEAIPYPSTFEVSVTWKEYLIILKDKIANLLVLRDNKPMTYFPFYIILAFVSLILAIKNKVKMNNIYVWLLIVSTFTLLFKFAIFPNIQERYFIFHFIIIFIALIKLAFNNEKEV